MMQKGEEDDGEDKAKKILRLIHDFINAYKARLEGRFIENIAVEV